MLRPRRKKRAAEEGLQNADGTHSPGSKFHGIADIDEALAQEEGPAKKPNHALVASHEGYQVRPGHWKQLLHQAPDLCRSSIPLPCSSKH